ncbi:hypothetical protein [Luteolibacter luteus]|uniref:Uncharacterized protein n=1 Tax=Luteolibacter luteus TaxID=2728835 RepID=A0A858RMN7_9BACT|nr:hypothetical protein [Luteolibacter luteus]QJE97629.1 hypothetical protein HHL09_18215 [Luteolibacter luteus]
MARLPFIHIRSSKFPAMPGEEEELVNEGLYGKAISIYLNEGLAAKGYQMPGYVCEDWGWWVGVKQGDFSSGVCVYSIRQDKDVQEYCACLQDAPGRRWSWTKFRRIDFTEDVTKLDADLREIFTKDPEIEVVGFPKDLPSPEDDNFQ